MFATKLELNLSPMCQVTTIIDHSIFRDMRRGHNSLNNSLSAAMKFCTHAIILY